MSDGVLEQPNRRSSVWRTGGWRTRAPLVAAGVATLAACGTPDDGPAVVTATVVDSMAPGI